MISTGIFEADLTTLQAAITTISIAISGTQLRITTATTRQVEPDWHQLVVDSAKIQQAIRVALDYSILMLRYASSQEMILLEHKRAELERQQYHLDVTVPRNALSSPAVLDVQNSIVNPSQQ